MNKRKEKKIIFYIKLSSIICAIILCLELGYLINHKYFNDGESIYFDSINAISNVNDMFITVGSNNNNENYYEKAKLSFYNIDYEKKLERIYNKGYNSAFFGMDSFKDGVVAVGSYEVDDEEHNAGIRSALLVGYDFDGNILFENDFKVLDNSKFMDVESIDDGYFVVGQSIYDEMTLGNSSDGGAFLLKYDSDGKLLWKSNFGDNKEAIFNDLYVSDDYIYVVGYNINDIGIFAKYNYDGELVNYTEYEFTDSFGFTGIEYCDGDFVVTGGKKVDDEGSVDALIVKYDEDCNYIDEVVFDNGAEERFSKIVVDDNDYLIVVGSMSNYDKNKSNKNLNVLRYDGVIAKYKNDLNLVKIVYYGEDRDDHFTDILVFDNNYLISGYSAYEDNSYMSKFVIYSDALKVLEVK